MPTKTSFELLPEDLQGHIVSYVNFTATLELHQTSTNFRHIVKHIAHIIVGFTKINTDIMRTFFGNKLKTLALNYSRTKPKDMTHLLSYLPEKLKELTVSVDDKERVPHYDVEPPTLWIKNIIHHLPKHLHTLNLYCNLVGDPTVKLLAQHFPKKLQVLRMPSNMISTNGVDCLAPCVTNHMKLLDLWDTWVEQSNTSIIKLKNDRPNLTVIVK